MRTNRFRIPFLALGLSVAWACVARGQIVPIETFDYTAFLNVQIPGIPNGGGVDFIAELEITSIDFTPGSVTFMGQPVDFDGTEASWLAGSTSFSGLLSFPVNSGPAIEPGFQHFTTSGAINGDLFGSNFPVYFGPGFAADNLDILPGATNWSSTVPSWSSPVVPELNGFEVIISGPQEILSVTPIFSGSVVQIELQSSQPNAFLVVPEASTIALAGLALLGIVCSCRRRR